MSRKNKRDGLVSKVIKFNLPKDEFGEYVPYCSFNYHVGIVLRENVCLTRNCRHYRRLYIDGKGRVDDPRNDDTSC